MKVNIAALQEKKERGEKITVLTAYDYTMAHVADEAGVDVLLVGDSVGTVALGYDSARQVTMEDMLHHVKPVVPPEPVLRDDPESLWVVHDHVGRALALVIRVVA